MTACIDPNVAFGEVAGPETRPALAFTAYRELNRALGHTELCLQFALGESRRQARAADGNALHIDIHFTGIERNARIAGGR
jgi:hypothetical protein